MRNVALLPLIITLSACGGSAVETPVAASASTGFAISSDDILNIAPGTTFSMNAKQALLGQSGVEIVSGPLQELEGRYISSTQVELSLDGKDYVLDWNPTQETFQGGDASNYFSVGVYDKSQYASTVNVRTNDLTTSNTIDSTHYGIIGYSTDPAALPARATYNGNAMFVAQLSDTGDFSDGTASLTADFQNSSLTGVVDIVDPIGDGGGGIDLGTMTLVIANGSINGNSFSADVMLPQADLQAAGVQVGASIPLNGGFYGPVADTALGVLIGEGQLVGSQGNTDVLIRGYVSGDKQ